MTAIKSILEDFSAISGLKCNYDKTIAIPVGNLENLDELENCGFKTSNTFTLLGMNIDNKLETLQDNFDLTRTKVIKTINF